MSEERSLAQIFRRLIATTGPISLTHYMAEANARYYAKADPFGIEGDFITAPEISQMFGELIGLWLSDMWIRAGRGEPVHYVELGPGRGTLARDALKAMKRFGLEPQVHFVETSAALRGLQHSAAPRAIFHDDLSTVPMDGPMLLVAYEFLDALPLRQLIRTAEGWREVMVTLDGDRFVGVPGARPMDAAMPESHRDAPEGTLIETSPAAAAVVHEASGRLEKQGGAALFIDYGHAEERTGSTFQAVRRHKKVDPFGLENVFHKISSFEKNPANGGIPMIASQPMKNVKCVIGMYFARPPILRVSCSSCIPWMTEPEPKNMSALKKA